MALSKCKECGAEISNAAKSCPQCGAPVRRTSSLTKLVATLVGVVVVGSMLGRCSGSETSNTTSPSHADAASAPPAKTNDELYAEKKQREEDVAREMGIKWNFSDDADKMGRGNIKLAQVKSLNTVAFSFPYAGEQRATLAIRKHPSLGSDVMLVIERGQFQCRLDGCTVQVRFDDGKVQRFSAVEPADNDSTTVFLRGFDRFTASLKKSKRVAIEATFFQQGNHIFVFDTEGFHW